MDLIIIHQIYKIPPTHKNADVIFERSLGEYCKKRNKFQEIYVQTTVLRRYANNLIYFLLNYLVKLKKFEKAFYTNFRLL